MKTRSTTTGCSSLSFFDVFYPPYTSLSPSYPSFPLPPSSSSLSVSFSRFLHSFPFADFLVRSGRGPCGVSHEGGLGIRQNPGKQ